MQDLPGVTSMLSLPAKPCDQARPLHSKLKCSLSPQPFLDRVVRALEGPPRPLAAGSGCSPGGQAQERQHPVGSPRPKGARGPCSHPFPRPTWASISRGQTVTLFDRYRHQQKNKVPARVHSTGKVHKPLPVLLPPTAKELHLKFLHTLPLPSPAHLGQVQYEHFQV